MVLKPIRCNEIFSLMSDEWTDISNLEQLSICTRTVNKDLIVQENFLGFYEIPNIKGETIVSAIKDALISCPLLIVEDKPMMGQAICLVESQG